MNHMDIIDMDEMQEREEQEREAKLKQARRTKHGAIGRTLAVLLCVTMLGTGLCGGVALYGQLSGKEIGSILPGWLGGGKGTDRPADGSGAIGETDGPDGSGGTGETGETGASGAAGEEKGTDGAVDVLSGSVVYSQAELDKRVAEAVEAAQNEEADRVLNGIKESLTAGVTTVETLRPYYPDDIVVVSSGKFYFVPINRELKMNSLDAANLQVLENGEYQYLTDGLVSSHKGIDVSSHQGKIDWAQVAQDGVEFAMIRLGYRGYGTEGKLKEDTKFQENMRGAKAAGIKVGVYLFSQAVTEAEVLEEANLVLEKLAPYEPDCPVVFDVERTSADGRMNQLSVEERTRLTLLFCQAIEDAGYQPMIYHNTQMGALFIDLAALEAYDKWYASYSDKMFYPYEYKIWQYSDKGKVQGINTDVDMNISFAPVWK